MNRPIRIGLLAEGETELGKSVPYVNPEDGGQVIARENEGALHTLIRRELATLGFLDCDFVQRHPTFKESVKVRTGYTILDPKYLAQVVITWKPEEVDLILVVVDADDQEDQRRKDLARALLTIRDNHLGYDEQPLADRSAAGLAIRDIEAWLLADRQTVSKTLGVVLDPWEDVETLANTKHRLQKAMEASAYRLDISHQQRPHQVCWDLAAQVDLALIKTSCPRGYAQFAQALATAAIAMMPTKPIMDQ